VIGRAKYVVRRLTCNLVAGAEHPSTKYSYRKFPSGGADERILYDLKARFDAAVSFLASH